MPIKNCRGQERKAEIIARYRLEPGPRCRMLAHQEHEGLRQECCQVPLRDEFFQFFYEPKTGVRFDHEFPEESGSFFVGRHCGKEFIRLLKEVDPTIEEPELFDPLRRRRQAGGQPGGGGVGGGPGGRGGAAVEPTPLNKEVMAILQLLATVCRTALKARMNGMLRWLRQNPKQDTQDWAVRGVNDAIREHPEFAGRTLRDMIDTEAARGNEEWRAFTFHHVEGILRDLEVPSFVDPTAAIPADAVMRHAALITRIGNRVYRVQLEGNGGEGALFPDCPGLEAVDNPQVGDRLKLRIAKDPRGFRVVRVYERLDKAAVGTIRFIDPAGRFAFVRLDDEGADVFLPGRIHTGIGAPGVGRKVAVRAVPTQRQPEVTWAAVIQE